MKFRDIIKQAVQSLLRHKGRSFLTVLGVVVGCCSVVIMISIGIGMQISAAATLAQMGDLTLITVERSGSSNGLKLDSQAAALISSLDNVDAVAAKLQLPYQSTLKLKNNDRYRADYVSVIGIDLKNASAAGYTLTEGNIEELKKGNALVGEFLAYRFTDTKRPEWDNQIYYYNYYDYETDSYVDLPKAFVDPQKDKLVLVIGNSEEGSAEKTVSADIITAGVLKEDWSRGYETSEGLLLDMEVLKKLIKDYCKANDIKNNGETEYSSILVRVNNISNVKSVEKEIKKMGFMTSSMESIREPMEKDMQQKQMLLGCVGGVAFFVAALGIANTMIMAITERTREIGVMKALGCAIGDIRKLFLLEAGIIGFIGGIAGLGLSFLVSFIMNGAGNSSMFGNGYEYLLDGTSMQMSVITWQLALEAIAFSVLVGVLSGLYPAGKAVRISALEAIRRE